MTDVSTAAVERLKTTIVFEYDITKHAGNPFHTDTAFGRPETIARGDVTADRDRWQARAERLEDALKSIAHLTDNERIGGIARAALGGDTQ